MAHDATKLDLVDVRAPGGVLRFGPGLTLVGTPEPARSDIARLVATAVAGPRPAGTEGTVEVSGRRLPLTDLPPVLIPPTASLLVLADQLRPAAEGARAALHEELQNRHAAVRLERHRNDAVLDRARARLAEVTARLDDSERAAREAEVTASQARAREAVAQLFHACAALKPEADPRALSLADEWDTFVRARGEHGPAVDLAAAQARVAASRAALARARGGPDPTAIAHIHELHRALVEAEADRVGARRRERSTADRRVEAARRTETEALAAVGEASYPTFLVAIAQGPGREDPEGIDRASQALENAELELSRARAAAGSGAAARFAEQELDLRARAAAILGRFAPANVSEALRAFRVDRPEAAELRALLSSALAGAGATGGDAPLAAAEEWLANTRELDDAAAASRVAAVAASDLAAAREERQVLEREVEMLTAKGQHLANAFAGIDTSLAEIAGVDTNVDVGSTRAAVSALLAPYRDGTHVPGHLPVVLDGVLDGLSGDALDAAFEALAEAAGDIQVVCVTCDLDRLAPFAQRVGASVSRWPSEEQATAEPVPIPDVASVAPVATAPVSEVITRAPAPAVPEPSAAEVPSADTPVADAPAPLPSPAPSEPRAPRAVIVPAALGECAEHAGVAAMRSCAQCGRGCCEECLVLYPGRPGLLCEGCAFALEGVRFKRRRGQRRALLEE